MALACVLLASCVAGSESDPGSDGEGGKADGDGTADAQCSQSYVEWLLTDFKSALAAQPIDSARATQLEELGRQAPCRGELLDSFAFTTWMDVMSSAAFTPYFTQHGAATVAFLMNGSAVKGDYDAFLASTQPTEATKLAVRVMMSVKNPFVIDRLAMQEWLDLYHVMAEEVMHPLFDPALIAYEEGYWKLNAGEAAMLDLLATTRPTGGKDGAYAAWVDAYGDVLEKGISIDSEDDYNAADPRVGCEPDETAPCGRATFLDRFVALKPTAHGDDDSMQWMWELELWGSLASTSGELYRANDDAQLARVDAVRPTKLTGTEAYRVWLMAVADTATSSRSEIYTRSVVPAKPCTADGAALYATFTSEHADLPQAVRDAAKPVACP